GGPGGATADDGDVGDHQVSVQGGAAGASGPARGSREVQDLVEALAHRVHQHLRVGDGGRVGVEADVQVVEVAEEGDVRGGAGHRAEGELAEELGAGEVERDGGAGHVAGGEVDAAHDRAEQAGGDLL